MNAINLKLEDIYQGKATMIKDNKYFSTKQYVEPFIDRVDKLCQGNFIVKAQPANQISLTPQGDVNTEDIIFNRINIEAVLPEEYEFDGHHKVLGMLYALDTRKPVVKQYVGALRSACLNLCVFNPLALNVQELLPESPIDYSFVKEALELTDNIAVNLKKLSEIIYDKSQLENILGTWIDKCINTKYISNFGTIKLAETMPLEIYKDIFYNKDSEYFAKDDVTTGFDVYNAFTNLICNKKNGDITNKFEKVYLVSKILGVN